MDAISPLDQPDVTPGTHARPRHRRQQLTALDLEREIAYGNVPAYALLTSTSAMNAI